MVNNSSPGLKRLFAASLLSAGLLGCGGGDSTNTQIDPPSVTPPVTVIDAPPEVSDWRLVWNDEFDGDSINTDNWTHEVNCVGGGNQEQQCYTDDPANSFVADGNLNIVAIPTPADAGLPLPYTSARLNTANKFDFKYGRIEMRAQLPSGQGSWPAFWMLPTDYVYGGWPRSGEIDIMEAVNLGVTDPRDGTDQRSIYGTLHYGQEWPNNDESGVEFTFPEGENPADSFHIYALEWQEGEMRWYIDGFLFATQRRSEINMTDAGDVLGLSHRGWYTEFFNPATGQLETSWSNAPFDQDFHLILNLAVGGAWPENVNDLGIDASAFANGQSFLVDYVRVYECSLDPDTGRGCDTIRFNYDEPMADVPRIIGFDNTDPALREGAAPIPAITGGGGGETISIFENGAQGDWAINACCDGNATSELIADGADLYVQFEITGDASVVGFDTRTAGTTTNIVPLAADGFLKFDVRVMQEPASGQPWLLKVESDGQCCSDFAEIPLADLPEGAPVVGEWVSYSVPVADLIAAGLNPSLVDAVFIFPGFTTGAGAIVQFNNFRFESAGAVPTETVFDDAEVAPWAVNACCDGNANSELVTLDDGNVVVEYNITGEGSVVGFETRAASESLNIVPFAASGALKFDVYVVAEPASGSPWLVKVESDGQCCSDFAEMTLADLPEGAPVVGEWVSYSIPVSDLIGAGLNPSLVDAIWVFPGFTTGAGATVRLDNVRFESGGVAGGGNGGGDGGGDGGGNPDPEPEPPMSFAIGQEQISDGSFDGDGSDWSLGSGSIIDDGGNRVYFAEVSTAGDPWAVNLSQPMTLSPARNYILNFRAKASQARSIIAGLGLNADPWTSVTESVALTEEWQSFTLHLTTMDEEGNGFGDDNSRVLFDMGAEVGDVYIDDVSVVFDSQLVVNSGFNMGIAGWSGGETVTEGDNTYYAATVETAGNPWEVNLSQVLPLVPNTPYTLTFRARTTQDRSIVAGVGLNYDPWTNVTESVALTGEWQTFELSFTTTDADGNGFGDDNNRVLFDMGAEVGNVHLDDITLVQGTGELLTNGDFSNGTEGWNGGETAEEDGNSYFTVNVETAGDPWAVNLSQVLPIIPDTRYVLTFRARSDMSRGMIAGIGLNQDPWSSNTETVALGTEWQTYTLLLTSVDDGGAPFGMDNSRVLFDMGAEVGMVHIDDVSLKLDTSSELVSNGDFSSNIEGWNGGEVAEEEGNFYFQANVETAGDPWAVNLSQVLALAPGSQYVFSFRARSTVERGIIAGIGLNEAPWSANTQNAALNTEWQTFTYTLNTVDADGNPFGIENSRVLFDMGAEVGMVHIDDVSLRLIGSAD